MNKKVIVTLLDEVNCIISGLLPEHLDHFYQSYGILAPSYFFNPKFKIGIWDGKIRFFQKTGKTFVYLLDEIVPILYQLNYTIDIKDNRASNPISIQPIDENYFKDFSIILRYYQVEGVNALIKNGGGILLAPTGSGKSLACAALVDVYGKQGLKTITIVPSVDLVSQTKKEFESVGLDVGEYSGSIKDLSHTHTISTWQSLQNAPHLLNQFNVVVCDETHRAKGNILQKLLNEYGKNISYRFGLTATMPKEKADEYAIKTALGSVQHTIKVTDLIQEGHLSNLKVNILQLQEDLQDEYKEFTNDNPNNPNNPMTYAKFKDGYLPDYPAERRYLKSNKIRIHWIKEFLEVKRDEKKGNVLCLVNSVAMGKALNKLIERSIFIYGQDPKKDRENAYKLFEENDDVLVLATSQIASTGINIPRVFNLCLLDGNKSFVAICQSIGRGLRRAHDKDFVNVYDICSNLKYSSKHLTQRIATYKEMGYPYSKTKIEL